MKDRRRRGGRTVQILQWAFGAFLFGLTMVMLFGTGDPLRRLAVGVLSGLVIGFVRWGLFLRSSAREA